MRAGTKHRPESLAKMRLAQAGENNANWVGDSPSYDALHQWLRRNAPQKSGVCQECRQERQTDWANISGQYMRDLGDYRELCRPCHKVIDYKTPKRKLTRSGA